MGIKYAHQKLLKQLFCQIIISKISSNADRVLLFKCIIQRSLGLYADNFEGTRCYDGQIFIGEQIVMMGRSSFGDTLL